MKFTVLIALVGTISAKKSAEEMALDSSMSEFLTTPIMDAVGDLASPHSTFFESLVQLNSS